MTSERISRVWGIILLTITIFSLSFPAYAKYSGGRGEPNAPYRISHSGDLMLLSKSPEDYDKHFIMIADIDLDPNLPGRKVFVEAVIGASLKTPFVGVFDGNGHTISNLTIWGWDKDGLGLFRRLEYEAEIKDLGIVDCSIVGSYAVGGLVGYNYGTVSHCYSTGQVNGDWYVGGLVGFNANPVNLCYSTGKVSGESYVGGLVGFNRVDVIRCYSSCTVNGNEAVGGLIGYHRGPGIDYHGASVANCFSVGAVSGNSSVGGLVGSGGGRVLCSFWDIEMSGQSVSAGGVGLTTAEMMDPYMLGLNGFANDINWVLDAGGAYPRLAWEGTPGQIIPEPLIGWLEGCGTSEEPYRINIAGQLIQLRRASALWDKHFVLDADIDLDPNLPGGQVFTQAVIPVFLGVFDGNGHTISNMTITGNSYLGLFGQLLAQAEVKKLGVVDVNITGSGDYVGGLAGRNSDGSYSVLNGCYTTGTIIGNEIVGGLVGMNYEHGSVTQCYSTAVVGSTGEFAVGGLIGYNYFSTVTHQCYSTGTVSSTGELSSIGGLLGYDEEYGSNVIQCFWDTHTSGQAESAGGTGKSTADMQKASTFLDAGWDFMDETTNGTDDVWWILKGKKDYPRLWWETRVPWPTTWKGSGTPDDPYQIATAEDLMLLGDSPEHYLNHFIMTADIDLNSNHAGPKVFYEAVIAPDSNSATTWYEGPPFGGVFDGNGHTISHLTVNGGEYLGLFGRMFGEVRNLGIVDVNITSSSRYAGALIGQNYGTVNRCYSTGTIGGNEVVGGLVGYNYYDATVSNCYSTGIVSGKKYIGGLVGIGSSDTVTDCFWDIETSGCTTSVGGIGTTMAEMQTAKPFIEAGWDFVGETDNGTEDIWLIDEGQDYPRLWWEIGDEVSP
jgi:hypothetical protein